MQNRKLNPVAALVDQWFDTLSHGTHAVSREAMRIVELELVDLDVLRTRTTKNRWAKVRDGRLFIIALQSSGILEMRDAGPLEDDGVDPMAPQNLAEEQAEHDHRQALIEDAQIAQSEAFLRWVGPQRRSHLRALED